MQEPVRVVLRPLALAMHEVSVCLDLPAGVLEQGGEAWLPAWTPGSYAIRDHARHLDRLRLTDAEGTVWHPRKQGTHRWSLPALAGPCSLHYRLFAQDFTVRTNHVDAHHAQFIGAPTFLHVAGCASRPWEIRFEGWPQGWQVASPLPCHRGVYHARDWAELEDAPFELGTFSRHAWEQGGVAHELVVTGSHALEEGRIVAGLQRLVEAGSRLLGEAPMTRYVWFLTLRPGGRGGLEHRTSTSLQADPGAFDAPEGWHDLFALAAHEYLHAWNVTRMKAQDLVQRDPLRETPTRLLWFHEGVTQFLQYVLGLHAGVLPWSWVARRLAASWTEALQRPGRLEQSLEESSFDAWIRLYQPSAWASNTTVSYYELGCLVAWMLDARLRVATRGVSGVLDWVRALWKEHGDGPITDQDLRTAYQRLLGRDPAPEWQAWIEEPVRLDAKLVERAFGLRLEAHAPWELLSAEARQDPRLVARSRSWCGVAMRKDLPVVAQVHPSSPAAKAGLTYGMEVLAVNDGRTPTPTEVEARLKDVPPGRTAVVLASLDGRVTRHRVRMAEHPFRTIHLVPAASPTEVQRAAFRALTGQAHPAPVALRMRRRQA